VRPAGSGTTRNTFQEGEMNEYKSETLNARGENIIELSGNSIAVSKVSVTSKA
jgi:hypothetical protein